MLPEIDEKQVIWEDMEVKEEVEPFGPSPEYITAATLEQMRQQSKKQNLMREYYGTFEHEWPDNTKVDPAACDGDFTALMVWHRDNIARCFGVPKHMLVLKNEFNWSDFMGVLTSDASCTPSRSPITGGKQ